MNALSLQHSIDSSRVTAWRHERALLPLLGGQTHRWHQHAFMPQQNVADHSWYVAVILLYIEPESDVHAVKSALYHDVAEMKYGDLSSVVKRRSKSVAAETQRAETETLRQWTGHDLHSTPTLKIADKLADLWQFALQVRLGNREAELGFEKHLFWLEELNLDSVPRACELRDAIVNWCKNGSSIFTEDVP